jgi:CHAT domain-containing protein
MVQERDSKIERRGFARAMLALTLLLVAPAVFAQRPGRDIEDYHPPYSMSDPIGARAVAAYDAQNAPEAERLSRQLLARALKRPSGAALAQVEARFILAQALEDEHRYTEAETEYRLGLKLLEPLVAANLRTKPDAKVATARRWARYFEILLQDNLKGQGRLQEARLLPSILPPDPQPLGPSRSESGVTSVGPIALSPCSGAGPDLRPLSDAETAERAQWNDAAEQQSAAADFVGAESYLRRILALDIASFGNAHCETAVDHRRIAQALLAQNQLSEADAEARGALAILDQLHEDRRQTVAALVVLADITAKRQGAGDAEPHLRRALEIFERRQGVDRSETVSVRLMLGGNLLAQGRLADAERVYRRALVSVEAASGERPALALELRQLTGDLAGRQNKLAEAVRDYRVVCATRAELLAQSGRGATASLLKSTDQDDARNCALRAALALWRWAVAGGGSAAADRPQALRNEAFAMAQAALPSASSDTLARAAARIAATASGAGDLAERYEAAIRARDQAGEAPRSRLHDPMADAPEPEQQRQAREALDRQIADIASKLARDQPLYWDIRMPRPLDVAALRARDGAGHALLRPDEALVFFMIPEGDEHGLVFAASQDKVGWARIDMTGAALKTAIGNLRGDIDNRAYGVAPGIPAQGHGHVPFDRALSYRLYRALLGDPQIQAVIGARKTLIIVPSGALTTLPPGLLVTAPPVGGAAGDMDAETMRQTAWLLRSKAVAVLPSVASLRTIRQVVPHRASAASDPLLAFANPDFSGSGARAGQSAPLPGKRRTPDNYAAYFRGGKPVMEALRTLPPLPYTQTEGMALATALGASPGSVLVGRDASKAELMRRSADGRLAHVRVLEFATHGLVAGEARTSAEPALVLAAGTKPEDWLLTASDAATLRLNAEWVLLSACNTAGPGAEDADGLSGLARGFFYAGAASLLVSHWTIGDETAARLVPMTILLNGRQGLSKAEALRHASLAILDDRGHDQTHPVYWAPFVLIGDPH